MKITAAVIQDLYHYALVLQGNGDSAFDCATLRDRLDVADRVYCKLTTLDEDQHDVKSWDALIDSMPKFKHEADLTYFGTMLESKVLDYAAFCGVDPRTGETLEPREPAAEPMSPEEAELEALYERGDMRHDEER